VGWVDDRRMSDWKILEVLVATSIKYPEIFFLEVLGEKRQRKSLRIAGVPKRFEPSTSRI
jgi:hypothetical protein